ncbi:MAG: DUF2142 domain-containing protein [Clostridiales Family XIII bacterium]|jgi:uncharacterized membrane protein|nr:DUF2142 domain-containing protein [Clostridiales Family XIII bacterium]
MGKALSLPHPHSFSVPLARLALIAILATGAFYLFVFPPNSAPDEAIHFSSAYETADILIGQQSGDVLTINMRKADTSFHDDQYEEIDYSNFPDKYTYGFFERDLTEAAPDADGSQVVPSKRLTGVPYPYIYGPQAVGILLARLLHTNPVWLYLLARIFNLVFYAVCIWLAVKLTPVGKGIFALIAMWPMLIELAASVSSDIFSIALAFLAFAQYLRIAHQEQPAKLRDLALLVCTMALLGPPKVVFMPVFMLAFFLPKHCFASRKYDVLFRVLIAVIFALLLYSILDNFTHRGEDGTPIITHGAGPFYTVADLLEDPRFFAASCKRTVTMYAEFYLHSMIGADLGWLEIHVNKILIEVFLALSVLAGLRARADFALAPPLSWRKRLMFGLIFLLAALGTAIVMFVSWTPYGAWYIEGIQGRYFLPAIPALFFALLGWRRQRIYLPLGIAALALFFYVLVKNEYVAAIRDGSLPFYNLPLLITFVIVGPLLALSARGLPVREWLTDRRLLLGACALHIPVLVMAYEQIATRVPG